MPGERWFLVLRFVFFGSCFKRAGLGFDHRVRVVCLLAACQDPPRVLVAPESRELCTQDHLSGYWLAASGL